MATTVAAPPEGQPPIGLFGRLTGVVFSPKPTFADIARKPNWLAPMLVMTVVWLALNLVLVRRVDWVEASRQQIERSKFASSRIEQLPPDQQARAFERAASQAKITRYVRGVIGWPLLIIIIGGIYLGGFKLFGGARLNYKTSLAIVAYAHVPLALRELIGIPVVLLKDPSAIEPENFLASNLAAVWGTSVPAWQTVLGAWLDVFGLWALVLTAIGFSQTDPKKLSLGKSFGIVFGISIVLLLIFTGLASLFS
jgi:hypothetical protein